MYSGKLIFSQIMDLMPLHTFRHCVARYQGNHNVRSFIERIPLLQLLTETSMELENSDSQNQLILFT